MCLNLENGLVPKEKKKISLLKNYTNFDKIKDMNFDEMAEQFAIFELNSLYSFCEASGHKNDKLKYAECFPARAAAWKAMLESEV